MIINKLSVLFLLLLIATSCVAQTGKCPKIPTEYHWITAEDYKKDADLIRKTLKWLCNTPIGVDVLDRSNANAFVLEWLAGSPDVRLEINTKLLPFGEEHPDLLFSYIHGIALFRIEKPNIKDEIVIATEGYRIVALLSSQSEELSHSAALRPLLKSYRKDRLKEYVEEQYASIQKK